MPDVTRTVGRFEIIRRIGRGGMATVYLAQQTGLGRYVALKELTTFHEEPESSLVRRFLQEARLAGALNHPRIVTVYDFFEEDGAPYIAMEYLERGSLRPLVGRLTVAQAAGVLEALLEGLAYAAENGVVHRDLKPENLLVTREGTVKIADLGIAKAYNQVSLGLTATGQAIGTPAYIAPEQAMGQDVTPATDLYATGVIGYELLIGRVPFADTTTPLAVLMRHVHDPIPPPLSVRPDLDPRIAALLERLLAKSPAERPSSAAEACEELQEILVDLFGWRWRGQARLPELPGAVPTPTPSPTPSEEVVRAPTPLPTPLQEVIRAPTPPQEVVPAPTAVAMPSEAVEPTATSHAATPEQSPPQIPRSPVERVTSWIWPPATVHGGRPGGRRAFLALLYLSGLAALAFVGFALLHGRSGSGGSTRGAAGPITVTRTARVTTTQKPTPRRTQRTRTRPRSTRARSTTRGGGVVFNRTTSATTHRTTSRQTRSTTARATSSRPTSSNRSTRTVTRTTTRVVSRGPIRTAMSIAAQPVASQGSGILHGNWVFDLDQGREAKAGDVLWEFKTQTTRDLAPQPGVEVANLGAVAWTGVGALKLAASRFSATPIPGSVDAENQLVPGDVVAVRTRSGNLAKLQIQTYGTDLGIRWTTYDTSRGVVESATGKSAPAELDAIFRFAVLPHAGATIRAKWYRNGRFFGSVQEPCRRTTCLTWLRSHGAPVKPGDYVAKLTVSDAPVAQVRFHVP